MSEESDIFPETQWSMVLDAASRDPGRVWEGVRRLCETYRAVILRWFAAKVPLELAEDLTQKFLVKLLNIEKSGEPSLRFCRGEEQFRNFLERSLNNFLVQNHRHETAQKRGGHVPHVEFEDAKFNGTYNSLPFSIDLEFARYIHARVSDTLVSQVMDPARRELTFVLLEWVLRLGTQPDYPAMSARFNLSVPAVKTALVRLRKEYHAGFRSRVAEFTPREQIADEHAHLMELLLKHGRGPGDEGGLNRLSHLNTEYSGELTP